MYLTDMSFYCTRNIRYSGKQTNIPLVIHYVTVT